MSGAVTPAMENDVMPQLRVSETARSILWLWHNDKGNWYVGSHAVIHEPTGIAIWTANDRYGLSIYYDVPVDDRKKGHPCGGRQIKLKWLDRRALHRAVSGLTNFTASEIQRQVSDWATDKIRNETGRRAHVRS